MHFSIFSFSSCLFAGNSPTALRKHPQTHSVGEQHHASVFPVHPYPKPRGLQPGFPVSFADSSFTVYLIIIKKSAVSTPGSIRVCLTFFEYPCNPSCMNICIFLFIFGIARFPCNRSSHLSLPPLFVQFCRIIYLSKANSCEFD